jgi:hypothetical protein
LSSKLKLELLTTDFRTLTPDLCLPVMVESPRGGRDAGRKRERFRYEGRIF